MVTFISKGERKLCDQEGALFLDLSGGYKMFTL